MTSNRLLLVSLSLFLLLYVHVCIGESEPAYGLTRKDAIRIKERVLNLIPRKLRFPFLSFGSKSFPEQCGCKCEPRQVKEITRVEMLKIIN